MSRQLKRQMLQDMKRSARKTSAPYPTNELREVPFEEWSEEQKQVDGRPEKVFRSRKFIAQIYIEPDGHIRISVNKTTLNRNGDYEDGITWDDLYTIKNQIGFSKNDCIEIYPARHHLVNVANMRHLFVLDETHPYNWRK